MAQYPFISKSDFAKRMWIHKKSLYGLQRIVDQDRIFIWTNKPFENIL